MKDNFDLYKWKQGENQSKENNLEFDLYEWNQKRRLQEIDIDGELDQYDTTNINKDDENSSFNITRGGDDPKIGAEEESDANVVGENKDYLESLVLNLTQEHPDLRFEVSNFDDIRVYGSQQDLADFGRKMHGEKFGEYEVFHVDDDDRGEIVRIVKSSSILRENVEDKYSQFLLALRDSGVTNMFGAGPYLQREFGLEKREAREILAKWMQSFSENLNESYMYKGYKDKHFDICPTAEALRDELLSGKFGKPNELDLGEWLYQHDVIFGIEKQVLKDKEGEESDITKAEEAKDRIINLSRDLGIPSDRLRYVNDHIKVIRDMIEYSALTESIKDTIRFIKEHNPEFTNEEIKAELKEIKALGGQLNEKLCKKGEAYRKRRMAAGEKSSAYLSGRAVKVCKGQMSGKKKKK